MSQNALNPWLKIGLEIGPIVVFFLAFQYGADLIALPEIRTFMVSLIGAEAAEGQTGPLFLATVAFMVAISISLGCSWTLTRTLPRMAVVTGIVVVVFGGLTLFLRDETFIKMKPTVVNGLFALILGIGLLQGRSYLKYLMGDALPLDDQGWMIFTKRWVWFFIFLAVVNEIVWRTQTDAFWVSFKTFVNPPLTIGFMALQLPLLQRHMIEESSDSQ
ncbi:MAG: septation protein A [Pseudomonadota bacterium]